MEYEDDRWYVSYNDGAKPGRVSALIFRLKGGVNDQTIRLENVSNDTVGLTLMTLRQRDDNC